jgi:hypothetical protein
MLRITSHPVLSGLLLCLSFGTMSSFAAAQASVGADLSAPNFSSFSRNNNVVRWEQLVGLITAQGLSNPVANIASGTTPWHARNGAAAVDLTNGEAAFFVQGLVLIGGDTSGTNGPVNSVEGALCAMLVERIRRLRTPPQFRWTFKAMPSLRDAWEGFRATCSNPIFLVLNAAKGIWIATGTVRTIQDVR